MTTLRLAHRGDWRSAPENSLEAIRAALAIPACDGLEFDVQPSADGVPVLLHDETLLRVQGVDARCADLPVRELVRLGIPTFEAVLELVAASARRPEPFLDIEFKAPVPAAVPLIDAARGESDGTLRRAVVSTFHPATMAWLAAERPSWARWGNVEDLGPKVLEVAARLGCEAVSADWRTIDAASMASARDHGLDVAAWTVRDRRTFRRLERLGVIAICAEAAALDG